MVFFSTIFRQFQANNCRNSELEENFGRVDRKTAELGQDFGPVRLYVFAKFLLKISEILSYSGNIRRVSLKIGCSKSKKTLNIKANLKNMKAATPLFFKMKC